MPTTFTPADARARLIEIVRMRSYRYGTEITLASGRTSLFYFNMKPTMLHPEGAYLIARLVHDNLKDAEVDLIGGLEMGAVPLASAVAAVSPIVGRPVAAFIVRKEAKGHGTKSLIEGLATGESLTGKRCVVVEDVTTTGGSAIKAAALVKAEGGEVVRVLTILDRQEGAQDAFAEAGLPFQAILTRSDFHRG
ncbi:MAG: orotate phosphoribosyltransferase [Hyphomicrobiaceae bacterium]|nr:orotate phosphoribosyltransferase [Hyphomicrobiaceae bacterium]